MDYEFRFDRTTGKVKAFFSMGHEAIGYWLNDEIDGDRHKLQQVEIGLQQVSERLTAQEYLLPGNEFSLIIFQHEVEIRANHLNINSEITQDDLDYYDAESYAVCGFDDFVLMLQHYAQFVNTNL